MDHSALDYDAGTPGLLDPDLLPVVEHDARHRGRYPQPLLRLFEALALGCGELLALLAPVECVCCGREDTELCGGCARRIRKLCARPFRAEAQAPALLTVDGEVLVAVVAAGQYREELAQAVLSFKRFGQRRLAVLLGQMLERGLRAATGEDREICLVPVPSTSAAFRRRGFSPVHMLLGRRRYRAGNHWVLRDVLCKARPDPVARTVPLLRQWRGVRLSGLAAVGLGLAQRAAGSAGQKGLDRGSRARRVRGSMRVLPARKRFLTGRPCVIVDDVLTTGATIAEAARAVEAAGGIVCGAVVLAATRAPSLHSTSLQANGGTAAGGSGDSKQI